MFACANCLSPAANFAHGSIYRRCGIKFARAPENLHLVKHGQHFWVVEPMEFYGANSHLLHGGKIQDQQCIATLQELSRQKAAPVPNTCCKSAAALTRFVPGFCHTAGLVGYPPTPQKVVRMQIVGLSRSKCPSGSLVKAYEQRRIRPAGSSLGCLGPAISTAVIGVNPCDTGRRCDDAHWGSFAGPEEAERRLPGGFAQPGHGMYHLGRSVGCSKPWRASLGVTQGSGADRMNRTMGKPLGSKN